MILIGSFIILTSLDGLTSATKTRVRECIICGGRPWSIADEKEKAPKPDIAAAKGGKSKEVAVTPQSSVQEGSKLPVSDMSNATQHPSLPMPQMIPLPLFYNSGESEGSSNGMTSETKKTSDMDEINGESGYGELFTGNKTDQAQEQQHEQVSQVSPLVSGDAGICKYVH